MIFRGIRPIVHAVVWGAQEKNALLDWRPWVAEGGSRRAAPNYARPRKEAATQVGSPSKGWRGGQARRVGAAGRRSGWARRAGAGPYPGYLRREGSPPAPLALYGPARSRAHSACFLLRLYKAYPAQPPAPPQLPACFRLRPHKAFSKQGCRPLRGHCPALFCPHGHTAFWPSSLPGLRL